MKVSILVGLAVAIEGVYGLAVAARQQSGGVVAAPFSRRDGTRSVENDLRRRQELTKRANTVTQVLDNPPSKLLYYANSTAPNVSEGFLTLCDSHDWHSTPKSCFADRHGLE
jgi:hypothetical protein